MSTSNQSNVCAIKAYLIFTGGSPLLIATTFDSIEAKKLLDDLAGKGITKFIAYEIPIDLAQKKYGRHYDVVCGDLKQSNELRVLDYSGDRAFSYFSFKEMGQPIYHEAKK